MIVDTVDGDTVNPPYYVLDEQHLKNDYEELYKAFSSKYQKFIIAYSYKANYVPYMCKILHDLGSYAEVVSRLEYDLASRLMDDKSLIIFNGPVKSYEDIEIALDNNSLVNLDSFYEIEHVKKYCKHHRDKNIKVGLRINFAVPDNVGLHVRTSRFGFCIENGDLQEAVNRLSSISNLDVGCLHCHFSSRPRSVEIFREITRSLCKVVHNYFNGTMEFIDIGGNLGRSPSEMSDLSFPTFEEYADAITSELKNNLTTHFEPFLIIEPGISLVGQNYDFVCNVIEIKKVRDTLFIVVDGSVHNIKPTMHKFSLPVKVFGHDGKEKRGFNFTYQIVGYTCMETDYLYNDFRGPEVKRGDFIVFSNVGAYTIVLNPPFIQPRPAILTKTEDEYKIIRKAEEVSDFFKTYVF